MIDGGIVGCPVRGEDVDLDRCLGCHALREVVGDQETGLRYVVCAGLPPQPATSGYDRVAWIRPG